MSLILTGSSLVFPSPVAMASVSVVSHLEFPELRGLCMPASVKLTSGCFFVKLDLVLLAAEQRPTLQLVMVHCWRWEQPSRHWFQNRLKTTLQVFPTVPASSLVLLENSTGLFLSTRLFPASHWCRGV